MPTRHKDEGSSRHAPTDNWRDDEVNGNGNGNGSGNAGPSRLELVQKALFAPFNHKKSDSARILSELAPVIMTPKMMKTAGTVNERSRPAIDHRRAGSGLDFATLGRAPLRLGMGSRRLTSRDLQVMEATEELLKVDVPSDDEGRNNVSLLRGFNATIPSAEQSRTRRRQMRNVDAKPLGLKKLGHSARGLLTEDDDGHSVTSEDDVVIVPQGRKGKKRRGRESLAASKLFGKDELSRQKQEILRDKENIHVRRSLISNEMTEISRKIEALDIIRVKLENDLLKLQEDELELEDELEGVQERIEFEQEATRAPKLNGTQSHLQLPQTSRRRHGPAFLPSEHDDLPPGVAFMSLEGHSNPILALDMSEPYGTLVTSAQDEPQPIVWDLLYGTQIGRLKGHTGAVKTIQVEDHICVTGSEDGSVRLWDLRQVDNEDGWGEEGEFVSLSDVAEESEDGGSIRDGKSEPEERNDSCIRILEGHTKTVSSLYFEDKCLVTGASDKTLRQWDLSTGQCIMTMDILWALSHSTSPSPPRVASSLGTFSVPTPPYADGSWDMYTDFVGGVQFWGFGLVSGSGDGAVRMWDMRTGQAHRTLLGHTEPVTCLQFDELHIMSGSLDKTIRIWDLRTGGVSQTLKYDHPVTALQFDTRKVVATTGENGISVFNRTSMQQSTMMTNGHTRPAQRLRYMDRYMVSGGRDSVVKVWSL
ncbi:WD40 repeat-like protein [Cylindrobasidium torrendii FP15055 ss-10]|uniref:WD40 repeat-like protein n=1 Tax=Cylindrobasidium torrendii FP15055 ss-10 TaxID=1314674 RepID=A0A0D7B187_9AGAR|nr:WD40 repeat-like protein [Cylindrobasidium torrendii FP15055 ss-10]